MRITHKASVSYAALALIAIAACPAHAQEFQITATGTITGILADPNSLLDLSVSIGTPYTFTFLFDYSIQSNNSADAVFHNYYSVAAPNGATVTYGDYSLSPSNQHFDDMTIINDTTFFGAPAKDGIYIQTSYDAISSTNAAAPSVYSGYNELDLWDIAATALSSYSLPQVSAYSLINFHNGSGFENTFSSDVYPNPDGSGQPAILGGDVQTLSAKLVQPTPEPSQAVALSLGTLSLCGLFLRARKRCSRQDE